MDFSLVFLNILSLVFLAVIIALSWYRRQMPGAVAFCIFVFTAFIWSFGSFMEQSVSSYSAKVQWRNFTQVGTFGLPVAGLFFALSYIGVPAKKCRLTACILSCWQALPLILIFSDSRLHLMRQSVSLVSDSSGFPMLVVRQTVFGMICVSLNYAIMVVVVCILLATAVRRRSRRFSLLIISAGITLPVIFSCLNNALGSGAFVGIPDSTSFVFSAFTAFIGIRYFGLLVLSPAARDLAFDVVDEGILVGTAEGRLVDMNPAARRMLGRHFGLSENARPSEFGQPLAEILGAQTHRLCVVKRWTFSLPFPDGDEKAHYELHCFELKNKNVVIGYTGILHDITEETNLLQQLMTKAERDPLTGVYNKLAFTEIVSGLLDQDGDVSGSLLLFDIDQFKICNDTYGHLAGDKVIKELCERSRTVLRPCDIFGRVGGDEFAVFFPGMSEGDALAAAERIRAAVASAPIDLTECVLDVSVSAGVASAGSPAKTVASSIGAFENLFSRADSALYRSKDHGRNRVTKF
jgi:diguanylate cyclase